jgi:hypothetical protein
MREVLIRSTWVLIALAAVARSEQPDTADRPAPGELRLARLMRDLGSDSFNARDHAAQALAEMGAEARKELEASVTHSDPEVRLRAKDLLNRLKARDLWQATKVASPTGTVPAAKVLNDVSESSGNTLMLGDQYGSFHEQDVTFDRPIETFWELIDETCRLSGNRVRTHYDARQAGLVVVAGPTAKFPVAYSGPVRAQVTSARRVFTEELDYEDLNSELTHTFQLTMQMTWEDRFRMVAYRSQPELVAARTDTGVDLSATQSAGNGWNVTSSGTRQLTMSLRLHPPAIAARKLDTLKLKWGLIAVGDMANLDVTDLNSIQPHYQDDVELIVENMQSNPGGRCELTVVVNRDSRMPEPQEIAFQENEIELFDADGRAYRKQGQNNSATEIGSRSKITFVAESSDATPAKMRLTYPRLRAQKDLEITFRNVPLPSAKPE